MKRLAIITVGKTHSGKTTFAKALEKQLKNTVVIDRDNHSEFLNTYYKALVPKQGINNIKNAITKTIIDYALNQTDLNIILCNGNRSWKNRTKLLSMFHDAGFYSIIIYFNIPNEILEARVLNSNRSTKVMRKTANFRKLLARQQIEDERTNNIKTFRKDEANYLFEINNSEETQLIIEKIVDIYASLEAEMKS